jgi:YegS/Rv2252/BmrU family lipid kinase
MEPMPSDLGSGDVGHADGADVGLPAPEHVRMAAPKPAGLAAPKRAAIVVNPTKIHHQASFAAAVGQVMGQHGWSDPIWLETTADDSGYGQTRQALAAGADLVLACGGDGTVTACADSIAGSQVPLGILPMGTGNLLARNVGLPSAWRDALAVALTGITQEIDAGAVNGRSFVVMAGLGLDAKMLRDTTEPLKRRLGWAAYVLSVLRHLRDRPMRVSVAVDDGPQIRTRASAVIVGNVGWLRGGLPLMPDARPDDGLLDAVLVIARGPVGWLTVAAQVILRRKNAEHVQRLQFTELRLEADRPQPWELDGEFMGETTQLTVSALPGRLMVRLPLDREIHWPAREVAGADEGKTGAVAASRERAATLSGARRAARRAGSATGTRRRAATRFPRRA